MLRLMFLAFSVLIPCGAELLAEPTPSENEAAVNERKNHFWSVSLSGERYSLKAGEGFEFLGNSGQVSLGYGYLQEHWFVSAMADIIIGPFNPTRSKELEVDYLGTGLKAWWGYSAQDLDLRHPQGGYGFVLGLSYSDFSGRSVGGYPKEPLDPYSTENIGLRHSYSLGAVNMAFMPGIFFCWLNPAREEGNAPSQLLTRIEGYLLILSFSVPLLSNYKAKFLERQLKEQYKYDSLEDLSARRSEHFWEDRDVVEKGRLKGFSILISFSALLGT